MLVAHAGGFGWDEAVVFALPVIVLVVLQIVGRRKAARHAVEGQDGADAPTAEAEDEGAG